MRAPAALALLMLAPALAGCAGPGQDPVPTAPGLPPPPGATPAHVVLLSLRGEPAEGVLGDPFRLWMHLANRGGSSGTWEYRVFQGEAGIIGGSQTLQPGDDVEVPVQLTLDVPGNVTYRIADRAVTVRVRVPLDPPPPEVAGPGAPAQKADPPRAGFAAEDLLAYDANASRVFERELHGTRVVLAVHRSVAEAGRIGGHAVVPAERLAEHLFATFERAWHVFGGFPYASSTWVVAALEDPCRFQGTTPAGARICAAEFATDARPDAPPHAATEPMYREWFGHEVFHLWNGGVLVPQGSPNGTVLGPESWFTEGLTVYYSARLSATEDSLDAYRAILDTRWRTYQQTQPRFPNATFAQLAEASGPPPTAGGPPPQFGDAPLLVYARGALVAYELDRWLAARNASLDDVMAMLYADVHRSGRRLTNDLVEGAVSLAAGAPAKAFFDAHVHGVSPLERPLEWVDHVRHRAVPAGRP